MKKTLAIALSVAAALAPVAPAFAGPGSKASYDGTWSVQIVTEAGPCDASYSYAVSISEGRVQQSSGSAVITGQISPDGVIGLGVRNGPANAQGSGRLKASTGSGTWNLSMLGCSGRWTAHRRTLQANAS